MFQMRFSDDFKREVIAITHWQDEKDIPAKIVSFIKATSDRRLLYGEKNKTYYCAKCVEPLTEDFICPKCHVKRNRLPVDSFHSRDVTVVDELDLSHKWTLEHTCNYLVFDITEEGIILYFLEEEVTYDNPFKIKPYKTSKISISLAKSYLVEWDRITNLADKATITFKDLDAYQNDIAKLDIEFIPIDEVLSSTYDDLILWEHDAYVYTDNLEDLKNTIYRYTKIWNLADYLEKINELSLASLTFYPLYFPSFEYLVNYKLYNLALNIPDYFQHGNNFESIFGVEKKYLSFMRKIDIDRSSYLVLKLYPTEDVETLEVFGNWIDVYKDVLYALVNEYHVDLTRLKEYLKKNSLVRHMSEYFDYIAMAREVGADLFDKKVIYPPNLQTAHDALYDQLVFVKDPIVDEKLKSRAAVLQKNVYEKDGYLIYPASSIAELIDESKQQKNCVRTYAERIAAGETNVYFMRRKEDIAKSFVTIEEFDGHIIQARLKYNALPPDDIRAILATWEKNLIKSK